MSHILSLIDRSSRFAETVAVALIFGYCALMLAEVVARAQARSFSFTWEFSQYAMAAIFALASGPAIRSGVHVRISLVTEVLPATLRRRADILATCVALAIVVLLVSAMWTKTSTSFERNILATSVTKTPLWIPQAIVLWGLVQLALDLLARVMRRVADRTFEWRNSDAEAADG